MNKKTQSHGYEMLQVKLTRAEFKSYKKHINKETLDHHDKQSLQRALNKIRGQI